MSDVKISALPVGVATSSTPFPAIVGGVTDQVTLAPIYAGLDGKAALVHTHVESDVTSLVADLALKSSTGHTHASTDLVSGTIATARLGTGTATSTTYLSGNQTYKDISFVTASHFFPDVPITPLVQSSWGWVNQSSGANVTQGATTVFMDSTATSAGIHARTITAPATPYVITAMLRGQYYTAAINQQYAGVLFRELGGKLETFYVTSANQFQVVRFTSPTVFSAAQLAVTLIAAGDYHWLRIADNGTNIIFSVSLDGVNYTQSYSEARGTFFSTSGGPQEVGIFIACDGAGTRGASATFYSWIQT